MPKSETGISVIMPCYNTSAGQLDTAVRSIIAQKFELAPYEIIIVDDASSNTGTLKTIEKLNNEFTCIRVYQQKTNKGQAAARNLAIKNARYQFVLPIDSDDALVIPDDGNGYMHQAYMRFQQNPELAVVYCRFAFIGALEGEFHPLPFSEKLLLLTDIIPVFGMHRREDALAIGGYDETMYGIEDWDYWIRLVNHKIVNHVPYHVAELKEPLYLYRQHEHQQNVHATHGISYIEAQKYFCQKTPQIYNKVFPDLMQKDLPEVLRQKAAKIVQRGIKSSKSSAGEWLSINWSRMGLFDRSVDTPAKRASNSEFKNIRNRVAFVKNIQENPTQTFRGLAKSCDYGIKTLSLDETNAPQKVHFIADPESAIKIAGNPEIFQKAEKFLDIMSFFGGEGVFSAQYKTWKSQRQTLNPNFNKSTVVRHIPETEKLINKSMSEWAKMESCEPYAFSQALTFQIFAKTALNASVSFSESAKIARAIDLSTEKIFYALTKPSRLEKTEVGALSKQERRDYFPLLRFVEKIVTKQLKVKERADTPSVSDGDLVGHVITRIKNNYPASEVKKQALEEVQNLILAGHESTGAACAWALHLLAHYPQKQEELIAELRQYNINNQSAPITSPQNLPYLKNIIKETLRMYPPLCVTLARKIQAPPHHTHEPELFAADVLNKGDLIFIMTDAMHHNPAWFPEPKAFKPERFNKEECAEKAPPQGAYAPFFMGPHTCPGQMMALQILGITLSKIFSQYRLSAGENQELPAPKKTLITSPSPQKVNIEALKNT